MKNEDQWFILAIAVWICRDGNGIVSDHIPLSEHAYHQVSGREIRYVIHKYSGRDFLPHLNYESPISEYCPQASSFMSPTRKYQKELDRTYFKYYDDAEEVLNNIITFCKWIKTFKSKDKKINKKILEGCHHLLKDVPDSPELQSFRQSMNGLSAKRRDQLSPKEKLSQDQKDLVKSNR